jgi:hypothetical protein
MKLRLYIDSVRLFAGRWIRFIGQNAQVGLLVPTNVVVERWFHQVHWQPSLAVKRQPEPYLVGSTGLCSITRFGLARPHLPAVGSNNDVDS